MRKHFKFLWLFALVFAIGCTPDLEKPEAGFEWFVKGKESEKNPSIVELDQTVVFRATSEADLYSIYPGVKGYNYEAVPSDENLKEVGVGIPLLKKGDYFEAEYTYSSDINLGDRSVTFVAVNVGEYGGSTEMATKKVGFKVVDYRAELSGAEIILPGETSRTLKIDQQNMLAVDYIADLYFTENILSMPGFRLTKLGSGSATITMDGKKLPSEIKLDAKSPILDPSIGMKIKVTAHDIRPGQTVPDSKEFTLKLLQLPKQAFNKAFKVRVGPSLKKVGCEVISEPEKVTIKIPASYKESDIYIEIPNEIDMFKQCKYEILMADGSVMVAWDDIKGQLYEATHLLAFDLPIGAKSSTVPAYYIRATSETGVEAKYPIYIVE